MSGLSILGSSIRFANSCDLEALVALETRAMHFPMGHRVREWFRGDHPSVRLSHVAVVEVGGQIVAAAALLPESVLYRGVRVASARWEAVATDETYRRRGLCRALFDFLSERYSASLLLVEGVTWMYRRFGYFPAMHNYGGCNSGGRLIRAADLPGSSPGVRAASQSDAPFLAKLRREAASRFVVARPISEEIWRHALHPGRTVAGPGETGLNRWQEVQILVQDDHPVGYFVHDPWDIALLMELEIVPGATTWRAAGAAAVRSTAAFAAAEDVRAALPEGHPLFAVYPRSCARTFRSSSDWAARIPDTARFLSRIAPALEATLAASPLAGWSGEATISRIDDGVRLAFEEGKLVGVLPLEEGVDAKVRLTPGRFEALVLGYRSLSQTLSEDPDCRVRDEEMEAVVDALFPPGDSFFVPI